jgi:predicted ferric reductase
MGENIDYYKRKGGQMAVKKSGQNLIGAWAFLIGVVLAIVLGLFSTYIGGSVYKIVLSILVILGILVGLLNVTVRENSSFLLAAISLVIVTFIGSSVLSIIPQIGTILNAILVLVVPATVIVALKSIFEFGKN